MRRKTKRLLIIGIVSLSFLGIFAIGNQALGLDKFTRDMQKITHGAVVAEYSGCELEHVPQAATGTNYDKRYVGNLYFGVSCNNGGIDDPHNHNGVRVYELPDSTVVDLSKYKHASVMLRHYTDGTTEIIHDPKGISRINSDGSETIIGKQFDFFTTDFDIYKHVDCSDKNVMNLPMACWANRDTWKGLP